jgi:predicted nucleotidyltransferase
MISEDIIKIKDKILATIGGDCEKIILFVSYAYGAPKEDSDYDFYIILKDESEKPILALQNMYGYLAGHDYEPVDLLANYTNHAKKLIKLGYFDIVPVKQDSLFSATSIMRTSRVILVKSVIFRTDGKAVLGVLA